MKFSDGYFEVRLLMSGFLFSDLLSLFMFRSICKKIESSTIWIFKLTCVTLINGPKVIRQTKKFDSNYKTNLLNLTPLLISPKIHLVRGKRVGFKEDMYSNPDIQKGLSRLDR